MLQINNTNCCETASCSGFYDAIVVGAGLAGLSAAKRLKDLGRSVLVLEARERCGGRTFVTNDNFGHPWDLGGQWIGATHHTMRRLINQAGLSLYPQFDEGKHVLIANGTKSIYSGNISTLNSKDLSELEKVVESLDEMSKEIPLEEPYKAPKAAEWDALTVETWQRQNIKSEKTITLMNFIVRTVFAVEPSQISFLFFLFFLRAGEGYNTLADIHGGAQQDKIIGGAQGVSDAIARELKDRVRLNSPVRKILQDELGVSVHCDSRVYRAAFTIIAIPPSVIGGIEFTPSLPTSRVQLNQRMPQGCVIKMIILYDRAFWREAGYSGEILSDEGPAALFYDATTSDGTQPALVGFIAASEAYYWTSKSTEEIQNAVIDQLVKIYGPNARHPKQFMMKDWSQEHWSKGCYVGVMPAGMMLHFAKALREPAGRIHWAGTETSTQWIGYMEGAALSGERAATEVHQRLEKYSSIKSRL